MSATLSYTEAQLLAAIRSFLTAYLPSSVQIIKGQINRVATPPNADYVEVVPLLRSRMATNLDTALDIQLVGSINDTTLTATQVIGGNLRVGSALVAPSGIVAGQSIVAFGSGTGGPGTYEISQSQTLASQTIYAGETDLVQSTDVTVQCNVHGPNSGDNAQLLSTLWRDEVSCDWFKNNSTIDAMPLWASDPRQSPFVNDQDQWEYRWTVDLHVEANIFVAVPMQFAGQLKAVLEAVETLPGPQIPIGTQDGQQGGTEDGVGGGTQPQLYVVP